MQMAETVKFLAYELFENEKIIIWAHNEHILENSDAVQHSNGNSAFGTMMGTWLKQEFGEALFSIGSFSYRGTVNASGPIVTLEVNTPNCLEVILYNTRKRFCFIDFSRESYETGNSWLFTNIQQTRFHRTGNYQIFYKPSEQFDGVLFIDTENPPTYLLLE
jgi:erythromycin esterase